MKNYWFAFEWQKSYIGNNNSMLLEIPFKGRSLSKLSVISHFIWMLYRLPVVTKRLTWLSWVGLGGFLGAKRKEKCIIKRNQGKPNNLSLFKKNFIICHFWKVWQVLILCLNFISKRFESSNKNENKKQKYNIDTL